MCASEDDPWLTGLWFILQHSFRAQSTGLSSCYSLRLKIPTANNTDMESSAPTHLFCWFGAPGTPNYLLLLLATFLLEPKVLELLDPPPTIAKAGTWCGSKGGSRREAATVPRGSLALWRPSSPWYTPKHCQVSCWEHPDKQMIERDRI